VLVVTRVSTVGGTIYKLLIQTCHTRIHLDLMGPALRRGGLFGREGRAFKFHLPLHSPHSFFLLVSHSMEVLVDYLVLHAPKRVASMSYAPIPEAVLVAIAANDSASFHAHVVSQCLDIDAFYVWTDPKSGIVCLRSVSMLAAWYAATDVLAILLGLGADVTQQSPDDQTTALHCACSNPSSSNSTLVIRVLLNAGARLDVLDKHGRTARDLLSLEAGQVRTGPGRPRQCAGKLAGTQLGALGVQAGAGDDEMQKDCFKTDDFRMYSFKVGRGGTCG
jgi:hypothetical protein